MTRVLVTGGCGFLGSHVCEHFLHIGYEVISVDNLDTTEMHKSGYTNPAARMYNYLYLKHLGIDTKIVDIGSADSWSRDVDYVVHTAAQPTMTLALKDPVKDAMVNAIGTLKMLEFARRNDIPISICSSVHVFGNRINSKLTEGVDRFECDPPTIGEDYPILNGDITPLHASKASAEIYSRAYIDTYGLQVGIMRLSGMYGPRQFAGAHHGWVSNFAIRILKNLPVTVFDTDLQVRDILYCTDAARVFSLFYTHHIPGLYVVGGGNSSIVSLRDVIRMIGESSGKKPKVVFEPKRFGDLYYFVADISKAVKNLGWTPSVHPSDGIMETVEWIRDNITLFEGIT